jgi:hypothetical protein
VVRLPIEASGSTADRGVWFILFDIMPEANSVVNQRAQLVSYQLDVAFAIVCRFNIQGPAENPDDF